MLNKKLVSVVAGLATVASIAIAGPAANAANTLTAGGSSFAGGIITACANAWSHNGDSVGYTASNSGTGRTSFANGDFDFGAADAGYTSGAPADLVYVPLIAGPVAIAFNVPGVSNLNLTPTLLGDIFAGNVTKWNDAAIKNLNKSAKLPNQTIIVAYRSGSSGTTQNLANYLKQTGATGWSENGTWSTAGGQTTGASQAKASSSVLVNFVDSTNYAIGYADLKDVSGANLKFAAIKNGHNQFVKPTVATSAKFMKNQASRVQSNGLVDFDYTADVPGAYNINLVTYGLAHTSTSAKGVTTKAFFQYVLNSCAPSRATALKYVALPGAIKTKALALVRSIR